MSQDFEVDLEKGKVECDRDSVKSPEMKQLISLLTRSMDKKPDKTGQQTVCSPETTCLVVHEIEKPECGGRKEKSKKTASKPPRAPRGPSLDAADQKLIREITELAVQKRARIERLKTLKKTRGSKDGSYVLATLFTIIICFIIVFQVISSKAASGVSKRHDHPVISVQSVGIPFASQPGRVHTEAAIVHAGTQK